PAIGREGQALASTIRYRGVPTGLTRRHLPQGNSALPLELDCGRRARSQRFAVRREGKCPDWLRRIGKAEQDFPGGDFPDPQAPVAAAAGHKLAVGRVGHGKDLVQVVGEPGYLVPGECIPEGKGLVRTGESQCLSIRRKGHLKNPALVTAPLAEFLARRRV